MTQRKHHFKGLSPHKLISKQLRGTRNSINHVHPQNSDQAPSPRHSTSGQDTMSSPIRTFHATCHCRASTLSFTISPTSLPLPVHFCHCGICRKTHGTLFSTHAPIPTPDVNLETFTSYKSSELVTKWFCKSCGAHILDRVDGHEFPKWYVAISLVDAEEEVWKYTGHHFVEGTGDGGLAVMMREIGGVRMGLWKERRLGELESGEWGDWSPPETKFDADERGEGNMLRAKCHCGAVAFCITMPDGETRLQPLVTTDPAKWSGRHCACNSCRLTTPSFISSWINLPTSALRTMDKAPIGPEGLACLGNMYASAKGVSRTFCNVCGASISYQRDEEPGVVKVAAGTLEVKESRAVNLTEWIQDVHCMEDTRLLCAVQAFAMGIKDLK